MKVRNVIALTTGVFNDIKYTKNTIKNIKLPKRCPVYLNWDEKCKIGTAVNFRRRKEFIVCDVELNVGIAPKIKAKEVNREIKNPKFINLSLVGKPSCKMSNL